MYWPNSIHSIILLQFWVIITQFIHVDAKIKSDLFIPVQSLRHPAHYDSRDSELKVDLDRLLPLLDYGNVIELPITSEESCPFLLQASKLFSLIDESKEEQILLEGTSTVTDKDSACFKASVVLDYSPITGFHCQISTLAFGLVYLDPNTTLVKENAENLYRIYSKFQASVTEKEENKWSCHSNEHAPGNLENETSNAGNSHKGRTLSNMLEEYNLQEWYIPRTYRVAIATTYEYAQYFGGTHLGARAAVVTTLSRVSEIYKRDIGVQLVFAPGYEKLITGSSRELETMDNSTLVFPNEFDGSLPRLTPMIDRIIGTDAYDVGHLLVTKGGGVADIGSVCSQRNKGQGISGSPNPEGDAFFVDYVAHEIGHSFGATHTFTGNDGACGAGNNFSERTAVEPGSGSTIMGYAGICGKDNLQKNTDPYFHIMSIVQISKFLDSQPSCGALPTTPQNSDYAAPSEYHVKRPSVKLFRKYFTIPVGTPFELGVGDPVKEYLYSWEQIDTPYDSFSLKTKPNTGEPHFRSYLPILKHYTRSFPSRELLLAESNKDNLADIDGDVISQSDIIKETAIDSERIPEQAQNMKFAVSVRDNASGFNYRTVFVKVQDVGPMQITLPSKEQNTVSSNTVITWENNGAEVLAPRVDVFLSVDGGENFEYKLGTVPNVGKFEVNVPTELCTDELLKVYPNSRIIVSSQRVEGHRFYAMTTNKVAVSCSPERTNLFTVVAIGLTSLVVFGILALVIYTKLTNRERDGVVIYDTEQLHVSNSDLESPDGSIKRQISITANNPDEKSLATQTKFGSSFYDMFSRRDTIGSEKYIEPIDEDLNSNFG